jgi:hypothetical protein
MDILKADSSKFLRATVASRFLRIAASICSAMEADCRYRQLFLPHQRFLRLSLKASLFGVLARYFRAEALWTGHRGHHPTRRQSTLGGRRLG